MDFLSGFVARRSTGGGWRTPDETEVPKRRCVCEMQTEKPSEKQAEMQAEMQTEMQKRCRRPEKRCEQTQRRDADGRAEPVGQSGRADYPKTLGAWSRSASTSRHWRG